jgi:hypothetical protein
MSRTNCYLRFLSLKLHSAQSNRLNEMKQNKVARQGTQDQQYVRGCTEMVQHQILCFWKLGRGNVVRSEYFFLDNGSRPGLNSYTKERSSSQAQLGETQKNN